MKPQQILDLYEWDPGSCFRHPDQGVLATTVVTRIRPRTGPAEEVRACRECVLAMEEKRQRMAEELGAHYEPGYAGGPLVGD